MTTRGLLEAEPAMVEALRALVAVDSPTADIDVLSRAAGKVAKQGTDFVGRPAVRLEHDGVVHVRWGPERPDVLLLGHYDTVWPTGTADRRPGEIRDGSLFGPGAFDMKGGIVQGWFALRELGSPGDVAMLLTGDEERGAPTSSELIEAHAAAARAVLVLEPSAGGALKTSRYGVTLYRLTVHGRAAHAGLDPGRGVNAFVELTHQVQGLMAAVPADTILTPGMASASHAANVVPASATCMLDVRARTAAAQEAADRRLRGLAPHDPGARLELERVASCPPLEEARSAGLFTLARRVAKSLGLPEPEGLEVGGASDGNRTASLGVPTLDGLGAVGDGAHADDEHVVLSEMPRRAALLAGLIEAVMHSPLGEDRA